MSPKAKAIVCFFAIILVFLSGYKLVEIWLDYKAGDDLYSSVESEFADIIVDEVIIDDESNGENLDVDVTQEIKETVPISVDFGELLNINPDVIGWIYCESTKISYPIMQSDSNEAYLHTMIDGTYNKAGSIFMDCRSSSDFSDLGSIIYGHNMKNDSMFGTLSDYRKQEYYEKHPIMWIITPQKAYRVEIIAALDTLDDSIAYDIPDDTEELTEYLQWAVRHSDIKTDIDISEVERVVTLSTCYSSSYDNTRYIVVGKLTEIE